jgi:hypothetical protein
VPRIRTISEPVSQSKRSTSRNSAKSVSDLKKIIQLILSVRLLLPKFYNAHSRPPVHRTRNLRISNKISLSQPVRPVYGTHLYIPPLFLHQFGTRIGRMRLFALALKFLAHTVLQINPPKPQFNIPNIEHEHFKKIHQLIALLLAKSNNAKEVTAVATSADRAGQFSV